MLGGLYSMEEERKDVQEVEEVKAEEARPEQSQEGGMRPESKNALIAFILSVVGFGFAWGWFAAIVGTVLGIISMVFLKKIDREVEQQPFRVFSKIAKILAIVDIIVGAVMFVVALIVTIVGAVLAAAAAANA